MTRPARLTADRGQIVPLFMVLVAAVVAVGWLAVRHAELLDARARAQTAADAAALAGVAEGELAANRLARRNGAELVAFDRFGSTVRVEVRVGPARAEARAEARVRWVPQE